MQKIKFFGGWARELDVVLGIITPETGNLEIIKNSLQEKAVEATKQEKERKEEKT
jgi:hypothetical protein